MPSPAVPETADTLLTERVCRVTLDLKVRITEVTSEILRRSLFRNETDQARLLALTGRQNSLLHALLRDKDALQQFLAYVAVSDLRFRLDADMIVSAVVQDEDVILKSLLSRLSPEEVAHICDGHDGIGEEVELLHECFSLNWNESILAEVEVMPDHSEAKEMP